MSQNRFPPRPAFAATANHRENHHSNQNHNFQGIEFSIAGLNLPPFFLRSEFGVPRLRGRAWLLGVPRLRGRAWVSHVRQRGRLDPQCYSRVPDRLKAELQTWEGIDPRACSLPFFHRITFPA